MKNYLLRFLVLSFMKVTMLTVSLYIFFLGISNLTSDNEFLEFIGLLEFLFGLCLGIIQFLLLSREIKKYNSRRIEG